MPPKYRQPTDILSEDRIADGDDLRMVVQFIAALNKLDIESDHSQMWIMDEIVRIFAAKSAALYSFDQTDEQVMVKKSRPNSSEWVSRPATMSEEILIHEAMNSGNQLIASCADGGRLYIFPLTSGEEAAGAVEVRLIEEIVDIELLTLCCSSIGDLFSRSYQLQKLDQEIKEQRAFQGQLLNSRNTLRALFDSSPASIYIINREYELKAINKNRADLAGKSPKALVGEKCYAALFRRETPCRGCKVEKTLQTGQITRRIAHQEIAESDPIDLEVSTFPIWDSGDKIEQAFLFEEDVTERLHLQASLAQSEKLAAVGQLAAGVAHEINNPLTTILANAQLLQRMLPAEQGEFHEMVELIIQASDRASQAVRDLLDFSRREHYEMAPTELNTTIRRTLALLDHDLNANSISLRFDSDPDLPLVNASRDHLQGVWLNLLINAIDAIAPGPGEIRIKAKRLAEYILITIADSGRGISPEQIEHIFEPFYTTKGPGEGTGLGLSICHQIITRHGGEITVSSQLEQGTTFTVKVPFN